ncbi:Ig-like domain-containing protein [Ekhidna sp.]
MKKLLITTALCFLFLNLLAQPAITSYTPAHGATVNSGILEYTVVFDTDVNYVGEDGSIYLRQTGASTLYQVTAADVAIVGNVVTITIDKPAPDGSISLSYDLYISGTAFESTDGVVFGGNFADRPRVTVSYMNPTVASISPDDGAVDVDFNQNLTITFNENIQPSSFAGYSSFDIRIRSLNDGLSQFYYLSDPEVSVGASSITINPAESFRSGDELFVQIIKGVIELDDPTPGLFFNDFDNSSDWNFTVTVDDTAPLATSTSPSDGGTYAPLGATGGIVFNEDIQEGSGTIALYLADGTLVESIPTGVDDPRLDVLNFRITWDFNTDLIPLTNYYILVSEGAYEDLAGNAFAGIGIGELDFTSNARPSIESLIPANDATEVAVNTSIILDFDDAVYVNDENTELILKEYATDNIIESYDLYNLNLGDGAGSFSDGSITLSLSSPLAEGTQYYFVLEPADAIRYDFNAEAFVGLDDKDDWTFTSEIIDSEAPVIMSLSPNDGSSGVSIDEMLTVEFDEDIALPTGSLTGFIRIRNSDGSTFDNIPYIENSVSEGWLSIDGNRISFLRGTMSYESDYYVYIDDNTLADLAGNRITDLDNNTFWNFTTEVEPDTQAPMATSTSPSDEGTFAPLTATGGIVFNEDVQEGSGSIALYLSDGSLVESITTGIGDSRLGQPAGFRITWDFNTDLIPSNQYYILVSEGAYEDLAGNTFAGIGIGELDFTANARPLIETLSPANNADNVAIDASLILDLDVNIYTDGEVNLAIKEYNTDNSFETIELSSLDLGFGTGAFPDGTISIDLSNDFDEDTEYYVVLEGDGSLRSEMNTESFLGLDDKDDWVFTTEILDSTPPSIVSIDPADNAIDLPIDQLFTVTFSEPVAFSELGFIRFRKTVDGSSHINIPFNQTSVDNGWISVSGNSVTFRRDLFDYNTSYYILFDDGVFQDLAGNPLTGYGTDIDFWNFTTAPIDGPELVSFTPMDNGLIDPQPRVFTMTFDETVQYGNSGVAKFSVFTEDGSDYINTNFSEASGRVSFDDNVVTVTFAGPDWTPGNYYVTLSPDAIEDLDGHQFEGISGTTSWNFSVNDPSKTDQTITFDPIAEKSFSDSPFSLNASATSGLEVSYSVVTGPISLNESNEVVIEGVGMATIAANQSGDDQYNPAGQVEVTFNIVKADQFITITEVGDKYVNDNPFNIIAESTSDLSLMYEVSGPATITDNTVTLDGVEGTVVITVSQIGDENYNSATASETFDVSKRDQLISFETITDKTFGDNAFSINATADSGLEVEFSVISGPVTMSGSEVTIIGAGEVTVAADQQGDNVYNPASQVVRSFTIGKADQTIQIVEITDKLTSDGPFNVEATTDSELELSYEVSGPASITGNTLTLDGSEGTVVVTVTQDGNDNFNAATASVSFEVSNGETLSIEDQLKISVYPNPFTNYLIIESEEKAAIKVFDIEGSIVQSYEVKSGYLDTSSLPKGTYFMQIKIAEKVIVRRIIKAN